MPSHKAAKQAAAEIAGNLSSTPQTTRRKDYRGGREHGEIVMV